MTALAVVTSCIWVPWGLPAFPLDRGLPVERPIPSAVPAVTLGYFSGLRLAAKASASNCRAASVRDSIRCFHRNSSRRFNSAGSRRM